MKKLYVLLLLVTAVSISSCTKEGLGGENIIAAFPQHHGMKIVNTASHMTMAYVKFNAKDSPGKDVSKYDASFMGETGEDHVHIEGLQKGDYFIYMVGFDTTINQPVTGGLHVKVTTRSGEMDVNVPVTE